MDTLLAANGGGFYLHGHYHSFEEYIVQSPLVVSNQLASIGDNDDDNIGVGVVDHNAFIYDATSVVAPWPFVMITAPVSNTLRNSDVPNPWAYSVCKDRPDNPVRALVFALDNPTSVVATVAGLGSFMLEPVPNSPALWQADIDTRALAAGAHELTVTAWAGGLEASKVITATFVSGPCDPLPADADVGADAGAGGGAAGAGTGASGNSGGQAGASPAGGAGTGAASGAPLSPLGAEGGCGCRLPAQRRGSALGWLGVAGLLGLARRQRRAVSTSSDDRAPPRYWGVLSRREFSDRTASVYTGLVPHRYLPGHALVVGLLFPACRDQPPDIKPASSDVTATPRATSAPSAAPGAVVTLAASTSPLSRSADPCRSVLGVDSITFTDGNASPNQTNYPEIYYYWIAVVPGPCPPTHVDITVTGPQMVGGVRARLKAIAADQVELLADPLSQGPDSVAWAPDVKRGQRLGTVLLRDGRAARLVLPKLSGPNNGLPVYHPETPLLPEEGN